MGTVSETPIIIPFSLKHRLKTMKIYTYTITVSSLTRHSLGLVMILSVEEFRSIAQV